ncbi:uncharacterized protein [Nicotiana sylvestris]|uniref:uncharacterized protein n=1 Tax=Nicotiana sylvestris TaxID=4096 RepID=UPI00388C7AFE
MTPTPSCPCPESRIFVEHIKQQRLVQFLSGLNESFAQMKGQIMLMIPTPNINEAYAMAVQDESQRAKAASISNLEIGAQAMTYNTGHVANPMASNAGYGANVVGYNTGQTYTGGYKQKNQLYCDYCKYKGHTRDVCYKLVGYPVDFKPKRKNFRRNATAAHVQMDKCTAAPNEQIERSKAEPAGHFFTEEQYLQLLRMLNQVNTNTNTSTDTAAHAKVTVSKLTRDLNLFLAFFPACCIFQDICNGKVKGIGRMEHGLYVLDQNIKVNTHGGLLVDDFSRFTWVCLLNSKDESIVVLKFFIALIRTKFSSNVKVLRTANGGEFFNNQLKELLCAEGITHQSTCPYTPQQNGVVERRHRYILDTARSLRFQANLLLRFWGECIMTAVYLINRIPSRILGGKCPFELLFNKAPSLDHLIVFGCLCYAANLKKRDEFSARAIPAVFLGYSLTQKGYKLFDLTNRIVFISRDVVFQEDSFPFMQQPGECSSSSTIPSTDQDHNTPVTGPDALSPTTIFPIDEPSVDVMPTDPPPPDIQEDM